MSSVVIKLTTDIPFSLTPLTPEKWRSMLQQEIDGLLELGVIRESESPYASPIIPVSKPDGSLRMCQDFRELNKITGSDPYPVDELLERAAWARFMSTLDTIKSALQKHKTAFLNTTGKYEYNTLPFGLKNGPA